jgi:hypothetical protein
VGGKVDGGVSSSTVSGVRVGQRVHSGHSFAGPVQRSVSDTTTTTTAKRTPPRYTTNTVVIEPICTLHSCRHCCKCHLRHNKTGYGRCMQTPRQPWPDCECAGKCEAGRCAQIECAGRQVVVDLTRSRSSSHRDDHRPSAVPVVSRTPTPSSSPTGARRAAGGVHADEAMCVGPQADARVSSTAAYRQPSTTVTDSGPAASTEVPRDSGAEAATRTAGGSGSVTRAATGVPANRRLPSALLDQLPSLSHQPRRLPTIADGRCSVAAVLLACGKIKDAHINKQGRQTIDAERRRLGRVMVGKWGEAEWIRRVPIHVRGAHMPYDNTDPSGIRRLSSHKLYHQLLTERAPTEWLDHGVFHLASAEYEVGVFVMYQADGGTWCCTRIGEQADRHIVLYQVCGHYEAVEYDELRQFPSDHEFIRHLSEFAARHPDYPYEEDTELETLAQQEQARTPADAADTARQPDSDAQSTPSLLVTLGAASARLNAGRAGLKQRGGSKAKRVIGLTGTAVEPSTVTSTTNELNGDGIKPLPALIAQVAEHGSLYERVSFHNQPQWRAATSRCGMHTD